MNHRQHIKKHVEDTMALLDQPDPIKAGPWFRSHVHNRLRAHNEPGLSRGSWRTLLLRPGLLMVVVILNFATFFVTLNPSSATQDTRDLVLSTMATEYQLSVSSELFETYTPTTE